MRHIPDISLLDLLYASTLIGNGARYFVVQNLVPNITKPTYNSIYKEIHGVLDGRGPYHTDIKYLLHQQNTHKQASLVAAISNALRPANLHRAAHYIEVFRAYINSHPAPTLDFMKIWLVIKSLNAGDALLNMCQECGMNHLILPDDLPGVGICPHCHPRRSERKANATSYWSMEDSVDIDPVQMALRYQGIVDLIKQGAYSSTVREHYPDINKNKLQGMYLDITGQPSPLGRPGYSAKYFFSNETIRHQSALLLKIYELTQASGTTSINTYVNTYKQYAAVIGPNPAISIDRAINLIRAFHEGEVFTTKCDSCSLSVLVAREATPVDKKECPSCKSRERRKQDGRRDQETAIRKSA